MTLTILLVVLFVLILIEVPLAYAIGAASLVTMLIVDPSYLIMLPQQVWTGTNSYVYVAIPLFIFMGELMSETGITDRLIAFALYLVRPIKGGLGEVSVVSNLIFGGVSGSSVADAAALSTVLYPAMIKKGFSPEFASGINASAATVGMILPPSIPMIMYAAMTGDSIGDLFIAGLLPGLLTGVLMIIVSIYISKKRGYNKDIEKSTLKDFRKTMLYGLPAAVMPVLIIVTIAFGIATASESAAIAVFYCLILGGVVYRKLKPKQIWKALKNTLVMTAAINIIIGFSAIFTWIMTKEHVPQIVADFFRSLELPQPALIAVLIVLVLLIGTAIDVSPAILMLTPILLPIALEAGMSSLQFGVFYIVGNALGLLTPPVGMLLNVLVKISGISYMRVFKGSLPFLSCCIVVLILTAYVPFLSEWLPSVISY